MVVGYKIRIYLWGEERRLSRFRGSLTYKIFGDFCSSFERERERCMWKDICEEYKLGGGGVVCLQ